MRLIITIAILLVSSSGRLSNAQGLPKGAELRGTVVGDDGKPVNNATVEITGAFVRVGTPKPRPHFMVFPDSYPRVQTVLQTDSAGQYVASGLPDGRFYLCVTDKARAWLASCKWGGAGMVDIKGGQPATFTTVLKRAKALRVHVQDAAGHLPLPRSKGPNGLVVGVMGKDGSYHGADLENTAQGVRVYTMQIPDDPSLSLWLFSEVVTLADRAGAAVLPVNSKSAKISIQALKFENVPEKELVLTVTGRRPR